MSAVRRFFTVIFFLFISLSAVHCTEPDPVKILFDFEPDSDLDRFNWECHTLFSLSDKHVTRGKKSLKLELFPSDYPGLAPKTVANDWQSYGTFSFDVYNAQNKDISLSVRIDDNEEDYPDYPDRYNNTFHLSRGANTIAIPINGLETSGTKRKLNIKNICRIMIFMVQPKERVVLYFDNFRLRR